MPQLIRKFWEEDLFIIMNAGQLVSLVLIFYRITKYLRQWWWYFIL